MKNCWRCRTKIGIINIHHIDGDFQNNVKFNQINLCAKCHNLIQGICDKCSNQANCHIKLFRECWYFEDNLPPIHFSEGSDSPPVPKKRRKFNKIKHLSQKSENLNSSTISIDKISCLICGRDISKERIDSTKQIICAQCVFFMVANPRKRFNNNKIESIEVWKNRIKYVNQTTT